MYWLVDHELLSCSATNHRLAQAALHDQVWRHLCERSVLGLCGTGTALGRGGANAFEPHVETFRKLWLQCRRWRVEPRSFVGNLAFNQERARGPNLHIPNSLRHYPVDHYDALIVECYDVEEGTTAVFGRRVTWLDVTTACSDFPHRVRFAVDIDLPRQIPDTDVEVRVAIQLRGMMILVVDTRGLRKCNCQRWRALRILSNEWIHLRVCFIFNSDGGVARLNFLDLTYSASPSIQHQQCTCNRVVELCGQAEAGFRTFYQSTWHSSELFGDYKRSRNTYQRVFSESNTGS